MVCGEGNFVTVKRVATRSFAQDTAACSRGSIEVVNGLSFLNIVGGR
jgi:hypothetical protein